MVLTEEEKRRKRLEERSRATAGEAQPGSRKAGQEFIGKREKLVSKTGVPEREALKTLSGEEQAKFAEEQKPLLEQQLRTRTRESLEAQREGREPIAIEAKPVEEVKEVPGVERGVKDILKEQLDLSQVFGGLVDSSGQPIGDEEVNRELGKIGLSALGGISLGGVAVSKGAVGVDAVKKSITSKTSEIATNSRKASSSIAGALKKGALFGFGAAALGIFSSVGLNIIKKRTITRGDEIIKAADSELQQMRESISIFEREGVIGDAVMRADAKEKLLDIFDDISELEESIQLAEKISPEVLGTPESVNDVKRRATKIKQAIDNGLFIIEKIELSGIPPDPQELAMFFDSLKGL